MDDCDIPVGITYPSVIADDQMKASSQRGGGSYDPYYGRLQDIRGGGWCSLNGKSNNDWLQVDLGKMTDVCAVATQGARAGDAWVTRFTLSYSSDENNWETYRDRTGKEVVRQLYILPIFSFLFNQTFRLIYRLQHTTQIFVTPGGI